jgi:phosphate-selective porin OprO/OprP
VKTAYSKSLRRRVISFVTVLTLHASAQEPSAAPTPPETPAPTETAAPAPEQPRATEQLSPTPAPASPPLSPAAPAPAAHPPVPEPATPENPAEDTPVAPTRRAILEGGKPFNGFSIQSDDGQHQFKLGAYVQADGRFFTEGEGDPVDTFTVRRARIDLRGTMAEYFEFGLQPELAGTSFRLLDAYVNLHFIDEVQLQAGKMKSPVGLEYLRSPVDLLFPEFGLPSLLVPQRDVGFYVHGEVLKGAIGYQLGVFNGVADGSDGDPDENDQKDYEGRIFLHPLRPLAVAALADFGIGVAGTVGEQDGVLPSFRTPGRETFFRYVDSDTATAAAVGDRTRISPQAHYYYGPVGLFGEYVRSQQEVSDGTDSEDIVTQAWQVAASVVVGGKPGYKATEVDAAFDPFNGTWGALELAVRYGELSVDDQVFDVGFADPAASASRAQSFGVAASWWFVRRTRALVSFDRTVFEDGSDGGDRAAEGVLVTRLQFTL